MSESQVVFFGAGKYAEATFEAANKKHAPVAYGDNDPKKQGTSFMGLPVLSLEQAEAVHPGCQFYLTVDVEAKPYVIESLVSRGIDRSRIINFEEYKRYKSCWQLENYLLCGHSHLSFCCSDFGRHKSPQVRLDGKPLDDMLRRFSALRDEIIKELNQEPNLAAKSGAHSQCLGCHCVQDAPWRLKKRVRFVNICYPSNCNFKCSYCCNAHSQTTGTSPSDIEDSLALVRLMKEDNTIDSDTEMHLTSGEISIHPLRDKILSELQDYPCTIFTNAGIYSEEIGEALAAGRNCLYVSMDAGTRGTFAKIKGVDLFDKVCDNLARYSSKGQVRLKYIILPGLNDNEADIDGFVAICVRLKVTSVDVTRELSDMARFGEHTIGMIARMLDGLHASGVKASAMDNAYAGAPDDVRRLEEKLAELRQSRESASRQGGGTRVSDTQVVFFGAGQYATAIFEALNKKYAPVAYGDNDKNKQGTRFMGLPVLSLEQAEDRHPNCRFFITVGSQAKPYLMESLVAKGVDRSRIINFEEYDRHKSCWWLETRMFYGNIQGSKALSFCCFGGKNHFPHIKWSGETHDVAMKKFFAMRDGIIESLNRPDGAGAQNRCSDCPSVHDGLWSSDRRVRAVDLVYDSFCNFKCFYCKVNNVAIGDSCVNVEEMLNFLRFIKHDRHIDTHTRIHFAAGEISVHPLRDKILAELQDNPCWIFTNAGAYCEKIGEALSRGRCWLYPSIDAGTRGTFAKIKGVDLFDKVCENLHRYSSDGFVYLKYIVLPGVNDGEADVNGFVELCGRLGVRAVDITGDMLDMAPLGDHAIDMVAKMLHGLQSLGIVASVVCDGFSSAPGDRLRIEERLAGIRASHSLALAPTGAFGEAVVCYNGSSGRGALPQDEPVTI